MYLLISDPFCVEGKTQKIFRLSAERYASTIDLSPCFQGKSIDKTNVDCLSGIDEILIYSLKQSDEEMFCIRSSCSGVSFEEGQVFIVYSPIELIAATCGQVKRAAFAYMYLHFGNTFAERGRQLPLVLCVDSEEDYRRLCSPEGIATKELREKIEKFHVDRDSDSVISTLLTPDGEIISECARDPVCVGKLTFALIMKLTDLTVRRPSREKEAETIAAAKTCRRYLEKIKKLCFELEKDNRSIRSSLAEYYYRQFCGGGILAEPSRIGCYKKVNDLLTRLVEDPPEKSFKERLRLLVLHLKHSEISHSKVTDDYLTGFESLIMTYQTFDEREKKRYHVDYARVCFEYVSFVIDRRLYIIYERRIRECLGKPYVMESDEQFDLYIKNASLLLNEAELNRSDEPAVVPDMVDINCRLAQLAQIKAARLVDASMPADIVRRELDRSAELISMAWDSYREIRAYGNADVSFPSHLFLLEAKNHFYKGDFASIPEILARNKFPSDAQRYSYAGLLMLIDDYQAALDILEAAPPRTKQTARFSWLIDWLKEHQ